MKILNLTGGVLSLNNARVVDAALSSNHGCASAVVVEGDTETATAVKAAGMLCLTVASDGGIGGGEMHVQYHHACTVGGYPGRWRNTARHTAGQISGLAAAIVAHDARGRAKDGFGPGAEFSFYHDYIVV